MEDKQEFEIINQEKYDKYCRVNKISNYACIPAIICLGGLAVCFDRIFDIYLSSGILNEFAWGETEIKVFDIATKSICALGALSILDCIRRSNGSIKELKVCYENAEDKENIEVPSDVCKTLKKYLGLGV